MPDIIQHRQTVFFVPVVLTLCGCSKVNLVLLVVVVVVVAVVVLETRRALSPGQPPGPHALARDRLPCVPVDLQPRR